MALTGLTKIKGSTSKIAATGTDKERKLADWVEKEVLSFNTINGAKTDLNLEVGRRVKTYWYSVIEDCGGAEYVVVTGGTGIADEGSYHNMSNGNQLKLVPSRELSVRVFGVSGDESTDLQRTQAAVDYTSSIGATLVGDSELELLFNSRLLVKTGTRFYGNGMTIKATPTNSNSSGKLLGATSGINNFLLEGIIFDGGVVEGNSNTSPLCQFFSCNNFEVTGCTFQNSAGIANNLSSNIINADIHRNKYINVGYTDGVGGVNAKQAIAFSSGGHSNVNVSKNEFSSIGLDCISIGGITTGSIQGNKHIDDNCYALIYNDSLSYNLDISGNYAKTAVNVGGSARPQGLGIDLPKLVNSTVSDNVCEGCSSAGLAIFADSSNVAVSNNVCTDNNQAGVAIHAAGIVIRATTGPIVLSNNLSANKLGSTQPTGFIVDNAQGSLISLHKSNKTLNTTTGVNSMTFSSSVDTGTIQFSYFIPLELIGSGSPEGSHSAPVGSSYTDINGGAGLVSYLKESGVGNTGWVTV